MKAPSPRMPYEQEVAILEDARIWTNHAMFAIDLQRRRLRSIKSEDETFLFRREWDFHFLIVALHRLRRSAEPARRAPSAKGRLSLALKKFDSAIPDMKSMRDVAEHIDDYKCTWVEIGKFVPALFL